MKHFVRIPGRPLAALSLFIVACAAVGSPAAAATPARPNIVLLLADDLGYGDLPAFGARDVRTPNLDTLVRQGVRFTQAYSNGPECTPSRTALLTGRHPQRVGGMECPIGTGNVGRYDDAIRLRERNELGLPPRMATLAPGLKSAGYRTAVIGKWHMGYEPRFNPLDQGFDRFFGILGGNVDYYRHRELSPLPVFIRDREPVQREGYMTDLLRDEAVRFIEEQPRGGAPFFLYLAFTAPHFPFEPPGRPDEPMPTAEQWMKGTRSNYVAMIEHLDAAIGRVLAALAQRGLEQDTLVVFASDNGAMAPGSNAPFRDFKETLFEGGIRSPVIARWPGRLPAGRVDERPWMLMDLTASFLELAGARPTARALDGRPVLVDVINGRATAPRDLFWRARRGERTWRAVRSGDLKYLSKSDGAEREEWLFDLKVDPAEQENLLAARRQDAARLQKLLAAWEAEVRPER